VQPNKAIVGANAFAHSSGIHQDGLIKHRGTYEIIDPKMIGIPNHILVLNRHSGRHAVESRLKELGFEIIPDQFQKIFRKFQELADKKKEVFNEDLIALMDEEAAVVFETYRLDYLQCNAGTGTIPSATVRILRGDEVLQAAAWGDGPVDATYNAIAKATGQDVELEHYGIRALTGSSEAQGEAILRIRYEGRVFVGRGVSTDIIEASAKAYISALNHMVARQANGRNGKE